MIAKPAVELTIASTPDYLAGRGFEPTQLQVRELSGGVSNIVLLVEHPKGRFVIKQALPKLRVEQEWFSDMRRIFAECDAMRTLGSRLPAGSIPDVLFEDQRNFAFAMTAAPAEAESWKTQLLRGETDPRIAEGVALILGKLIRESWQSAELATRFGSI